MLAMPATETLAAQYARDTVLKQHSYRTKEKTGSARCKCGVRTTKKSDIGAHIEATAALQVAAALTAYAAGADVWAAWAPGSIA